MSVLLSIHRYKGPLQFTAMENNSLVPLQLYSNTEDCGHRKKHTLKVLGESQHGDKGPGVSPVLHKASCRGLCILLSCPNLFKNLKSFSENALTKKKKAIELRVWSPVCQFCDLGKDDVLESEVPYHRLK